MDNMLDEMRAFAKVAEMGNFSRAGRAMGISQPSVSRLVSDLERRLGAKLLLRTTHEIAVTEAGLTFLEHARTILDGIEEATDAVRGVDNLDGLLRIAAPATFGTRTIVPIMAAFMREHPKLRVELSPLDETQALVSHAIDVAIRFGGLPDSDFGARRLACLSRVAVASPAYLKRCGEPLTPAQLSGHDCLFGPGLTGRSAWLFGSDRAPPGGLIERVRLTTAEGVVACAVADLGIAVATKALCREELESGKLVELLSEHPLRCVELHAVFPAGRKSPMKVRAFVDYLVRSLAEAGINPR